MKTFAQIVAGIVMFALALVIAPLLVLTGGWFVGFVIEFVTGDFAANTLNMALGTDRFIKGDFQRMTAILAVVATLFAINVKTNKGGGSAD